MVRICLADTYEVCHVATNLPVHQSTVYGNYGPSYAADGNRQTNLFKHACSHSQLETNPWWSVDLGVPLTVTGVLFTNRNSGGACRRSIEFKASNL